MEEELLEACGLWDERLDPDTRARERERQSRDGVLVRDETQIGASIEANVGDSALRETHVARALAIGRPQPVAARRGRLELGERAFVDDPSLANDRDAVAQLLDLAEQVAREQHRDLLA